ncbi:MAG: biotin carboxylase, partial [Phenylobacterium sp.]|nr:biotin carboxylase [Phenylobacterium sp.]
MTEAVTGLDLVQLQLRLAGGDTLAACCADQPPAPRGSAIQLRVNLERLAPDGALAEGAGGVLTRYEPPSGPGVRVDGYGYAGYATSPAFDPLIAKLVVWSAGDLAHCAAKARRAAAEFRIEGAPSSLALARAILERPEFAAGRLTTGFLDAHLPELLARAAELAPPPAEAAATDG